VTALPTGFRYDVVLRERPTEPLEIKIPVRGEKLTLREDTDGRLRLIDKGNSNLAVSAQPLMRSTETSKGRSAETGTVDTTVVTADGKQTLLLKPDQAFLTDTDTTYPVTLQSAVAITATADADVWSLTPDDPNGSGAFLKAGTESDGSKSRSYLKFNAAPFVGQQISNVTLSLFNIDGPSCGSTVGDGIQVRRVTSWWDPATVSWAQQPTNTTENAVINRNSVGGSCDPAPMSWDITPIARQWAEDVGNYGLVLMSPTERASANYRVFPSSENADFDDPPKLTATFTPIGDATTLYPAGSDGVEVIQAPANWGSDAPQMAEPQAHALSSAIDRAEANADALANPYVDMVSGQVVAPAATVDGHTIASAPLTGTAYLDLGSTDWTIPGEYTDGDTDEDSEGVMGPGEAYAFTPQVPDTSISYSRQTSIAREIMNQNSAQLPGADNVVAARIWAERGQVLVTANAVTPELRLALAQRYGTNAVVIRLDTNASKLQLKAGTDSRQNDNDDFINGGSHYSADSTPGCTMAFAWKIPAGKRLVTAGHCMPTAYSSVRVTNDGTRYYGQRVLTNYEYGKGTVPLPGQNKWLGDIALVSTNSPVSPTASIFIGNETSRSKKPVKSSWSRRSIKNDLYCMGGAETGQHCNWKVQDPNTWAKTDGGTTQNIVIGTRSSECAQGGDSGGPVYTFRSDGSVVAKGVAAAGTDPVFGDCSLAFTDITTVREAFGGDVLKRK
jgi:hypothetical protein